MTKYTLPTRTSSFFSIEAYKVPARDLFHVGDLVRAIGTSGGDGLRAGVVYEVISIDHPCLNVKGDGISTYGRYHSKFEKLTAKEAEDYRRLGYVEGDSIIRQEGQRSSLGEFLRDPGPFKAKRLHGGSVDLDRRPGGTSPLDWTARRFELAEMRPRRSTPVEAPALFKVGDKVRFNANTPVSWWAKPGMMGSIYRVLGDGEFDVKLPEGHILGAAASMLDPVATTTPAPGPVNDNEAPRFIICVERNGKFAPSTTPREYKSEAQAWEVANSMADKHPGDKFYVLRTVGAVKVEKTVTVKATKTVAA